MPILRERGDKSTDTYDKRYSKYIIVSTFIICTFVYLHALNCIYITNTIQFISFITIKPICEI